MRKNLFDIITAEQLIKRVENLQPDSPPLWGKMTATEMLLHCNNVHESLLQPAKESGKKTSIKQYLVRWIVLYIIPRYPKNRQTPKRFKVEGMITNFEFQDQKTRFMELVRRFADHKEQINHYHPYFGQLSVKEWGITSYKHADHHLRQFGL